MVHKFHYLVYALLLIFIMVQSHTFRLSCLKFLDIFQHYSPNALIVQMVTFPGFPSKILYVFIFVLFSTTYQLLAYSSEQMFNTT